MKRKIIAFILCLSFFLVVCSTFSSAENKKTSSYKIGESCVISEEGFSISADFKKDNNNRYRFEETAENLSEYKKTCEQTIIFLNENGTPVSSKRISVTVPAKEKTCVSYPTVIDTQIKYEAVSYYITYKIQEIAETTVPTVTENEISTVPYYIKEYNISANISETNKLTLTEKITVQYNDTRADIPKIFIDGKKVKESMWPPENNIDIKQLPYLGQFNLISASIDGKEQSYTLRKKKGIWTYKTGIIQDKLGEHTYQYVSEQVYGADSYIGLDNVSFILNSGLLDAPIEKFSFSIHFPKGTAEEIGGTIYVNQLPVNDTANLVYDKETVTGELHNIKGSDIISFSAELEDGYFVFAENNRTLSFPLLIGCTIILMFIGLIFIRNRKKNDIAVPESTSDTPAGYYAYEAEYINSRSFIKGLAILPLQLVNKGYVHIEPSPVSNDDCLITKINTFDGVNSVVSAMTDTLFGKEKETDIEEFKRGYTPKKHRDIKSLIKNSQNLRNIFAKFYKKKDIVIKSIELLVLFAISLLPLMKSVNGLGKSMVFVLIAVLLTPIHCYILYSDADKTLKVISAFATGSLTAVISAFTVLIGTNVSNLYVIAPQIAVLIIFYIMLIFAVIKLHEQAEYTEHGVVAKQDIQSFAQFAENITEAQAIALSLDSPEYFFEAFPYVYTLCDENTVNRFVSAFKETKIYSDKWSDFTSAEEYFDFINTMVKKIFSVIAVADRQKEKNK